MQGYCMRCDVNRRDFKSKVCRTCSFELKLLERAHLDNVPNLIDSERAIPLMKEEGQQVQKRTQTESLRISYINRMGVRQTIKFFDAKHALNTFLTYRDANVAGLKLERHSAAGVRVLATHEGVLRP